MAKRAPILLAGTLAAILQCGAATSQTAPSSLVNTQVQLGDVFSGQQLDVVEIGEATSGQTAATANAFSAGADGVDLDMRTNQTAQGAVSADTRLDVAVHSGANTDLETLATGNGGDATVSGATLTSVFNQTTGPTTITAHSHIEAPEAGVGDLAATVTAQGNRQAIGLTTAAVGGLVHQNNAATVTSDGGGIYGEVTGTARFAATTEANSLTSSGDGGSAQRYIIQQRNTADLTQAAQFTAFGSAAGAQTSASATGNLTNAYNEGGLLDVSNSQINQAYVRAQGESSAYLFGSASTDATAIGNNLLAGEIGDEIVLDSVQLNSGGGVEAVASFEGNSGYDASATATAMGNSAVGYACSECNGRMSVSNDQTNEVDVGAGAQTTVAAYGRSVSGTATAVGNSGTYYVSARPSQ